MTDTSQDCPLVERLNSEIKSAMINKEKDRLSTLRMAKSAIKQIEIDERKTLSEADALAVFNKLIKQRQESIKQYQAGNRPELAAKEEAEIAILQLFLPEQLSEEAISAGIQAVITELGATSVKDMGNVMQQLKSQWAGQADMSLVSRQVKTLLG